MQIDDVSPTVGSLSSTLPPTHQSASGKGLCVVVSKDGTKVYLGGNSGVWISDDGGETLYHSERPNPASPFEPVSGSLLSPNVYDLLISPTNNNIILAATGRDSRSPGKEGIYRSEDGAKTWKLVHQFFRGTEISDVGRIVVAPDNPLLMFAAGGFGVGISNDGGIAWTNKMPPGTVDDRIWYIVVGPQQGAIRRVYAVGTRVWLSRDGGNTWEVDTMTPTTLSLGPPSDAAGFASLTVAIHPTNPSIIYIIKRFVDEHVELWSGDFSTNLATWKQLPSIPINYPNVTPSGCTFIVPHVSQFNGTLYLIASDSRTTHISIGVPSSSNDWIRIDSNLHLDPHGLALTPNFEHIILSPVNFGRIIIVNDGGLYYSVDGTRTWIQGKQLSTLTILNMAILPQVNKKPALCIGTTDNSGFFSFDGGEKWKTQDYRGGDNDWCFSDPMQPSRLIVFAPRNKNINLHASSGSSSVPDGTVPGKRIPEAPRIPDDIRSWNVVSNFANIGYRPIILTLKNQLPKSDGDFITILSTGPISNMNSKTILVRTLSMSNIINATDWIPNTSPNNIVFQEGPDLPDRKVCIVQASGGHDLPVYYVGDLSTTLSSKVFLSGPKPERLWKWQNGMSAWSLVVPVASGSIGPTKAKRFFVDPYRPSHLYVLDVNHIYRSNNGGQTWVIDILMEQALTGNGSFPFVIANNANPEDALIRDMTFDPFDPGLRFAAGPAGVFYTSNGVNWENLIRTAANPMHITSLTYDFVSNGNSRTLYVSTSNRGLLRLTPEKHLLNTQGKLNFLRVHDVGTGWGPPTDFINVECVIKFVNSPTKAYGFQLRNDANSKAHQDMLNLLREAFNNDWLVSIDFEIEDFKKNGVIKRVMSIGK